MRAFVGRGVHGESLSGMEQGEAEELNLGFNSSDSRMGERELVGPSGRRERDSGYQIYGSFKI